MQPHSAIIALGSNLGDPAAQCLQALRHLKGLSRCSLKAVSSFYQSRALTLTPDEQALTPPYVNAVALFATDLTVEVFFKELVRIEALMGRTRHKKWESRLIDLDLIDFNSLILDSPDLTLPHPEMAKRSFVLAPLTEILPGWKHPLLERTAAQLLQDTHDDLSIQRLPINVFSAL